VYTVPNATIDATLLKPGYFGTVTFDFLLRDSSGYVWLAERLGDASENGRTEPERDDPDEGTDVVELVDAIQVQIWYDRDGDSLMDDDGPGAGEGIPFEGTLVEVLDGLAMGGGVPLDGDRGIAYDEVVVIDGEPIPADGADPTRECFSPSPTPHCIGFRRELPVDHGNDVQSDSVRFDLELYTEQCRHSDGTGMNDEPVGDDEPAL
jgi:hypothetical protein